MREIHITKAESGQRLDRFLGKYMPEASSGFLYKMMRKKNIKLNGRKAEGSERIQEGDKIELFFSEETLGKLCRASDTKKRETERKNKSLTREQQSLRKEVRVLFSSENVIIFDKPAGMLTQKSVREDDSLNDYLIDYCLEHHLIEKETLKTFRPSVANRLDRNTSGIVLCGITMKGLQSLAQILRERQIEKYYLCIVQGKMSKDKKVKGYLVKNDTNNTVTLSDKPVEGAAPVETWIHVVRSSPEASLLKVRLITGRSHQIRAHLAAEGHPVAGDYKYGDRAFNDMLKNEYGICYQMLHSYEIIIPEGVHLPITELEHLHVTAAPPKQFEQLLSRWHLEDQRQIAKRHVDDDKPIRRGYVGDEKAYARRHVAGEKSTGQGQQKHKQQKHNPQKQRWDQRQHNNNKEHRV
ncbi:MAG: RluA family pseudouridine synthase [Clostridiales bacterium]|nr:RluA family pseudouridine synthase [Clostridiales bacterium]